MPSLASKIVWDRDGTTLRLARALADPSVWIVALEGGDGIGKTALLRSLRDEQEREAAMAALDAFVYFSARGYRWITVPTLLEDLVKAVPEGHAAMRKEIRSHPWRLVLISILRLLFARRVAVVIDDADELFDSRGDWKDRDLRALLVELAGRDDPKIKIVLLLRRLPAVAGRKAPLRQHIERLAIKEGLPREHAEELLRSLDEDGTLGFREASTAALRRLWELTGGHPRALHLLVACLMDDEEATVDGLAEQLAAMNNVTAELFVWVFNKQSLMARRVLHALAVFPRPVHLEAVKYLLAGVAPSLPAETVIARLVRKHVIGTYEGHYYLAPEEAAFVRSTLLSQDMTGDTGLLTREELWRGAAQYFASRRHVAPERVEDLWPQLGEIEVSMLAQQWEHALDVITHVDDQYLSGWGQSEILVSWRESLREELSDLGLASRNRSHLADARRQHEGSVDDLDDILYALEGARNIGDSLNEVIVSLQLADAFIDHGRVVEAAKLYERQIATARTLGRHVERIKARGGLAVCLARQGHFDEAQEQQEMLFAHIARLSSPEQRRDLRADHLIDRAWLVEQLGHYEEAHHHLQESLSSARTADRPLLEGWNLGALAHNALLTGRTEEALDLTRKAAQIGISLNNNYLLREANATQAQALLLQEADDAAMIAADAATRYATRASGMNAWCVKALVCLRRADDEAAKSACAMVLQLWTSFHHDIPASGDDDFQLLDARGIALTGLVLTGSRSETDAIEVFRRARRISRAPGILNYNDLVFSLFGEHLSRDDRFQRIRAAAIHPN